MPMLLGSHSSGSRDVARVLPDGRARPRGIPGQFAIEARFWTDAYRTDVMNTACNVRAAIVHALKERGVELQNADFRGVGPGDAERWHALSGGKTEASLP